MRYIDDVIPDIQSDCDKIAKAFNKAAAKFIYEVLEAEAIDWYVANSSSGVYKRTYQLKSRALEKKSTDNYGYSIGIFPENIWTHPWVMGKNVRMGSYEDVKGQNMASKVLEWEERKEGVFSQYEQNIWGYTLKYLTTSSLNFDVEVPKLSISDEIKNDLIKMMKEELKKQLNEEYEEYKKEV